MPGSPHWPSLCRSLLAESKRGPAGRPVAALLADAERIGDPYYAATALLGISTDTRLDAPAAERAGRAAVARTAQVEPPWRRAELLAEVAKVLRRWGEGREGKDWARASLALQAETAALVLALPAGKDRSAVLGAVPGRLPAVDLLPFLRSALDGGPSSLEDAKHVLRAAFARPPPDLERTATALEEAVRADPEAERAARLLGYLHVQWARAAGAKRPHHLLEEALARAGTVGEPGARLETLRYLAQTAADAAEIGLARAAARSDPDATVAARLLATLGAQADRMGLREDAAALLDEAASRLPTISDPAAREGASRVVEEARARLEGTPRPVASPRDAPPSAPRDAGPAAKARAAKADAAPPAQARAAPATRQEPPSGPGHVLGLVNTYEGGLKAPHLQAAARAAPLCWAFGLDLALVAFPGGTAAEIVKGALAESRIGEGGRYLEALAAAGRLHVVADLPGGAGGGPLGVPIGTTPEPEAGKAADLEGVARAAAREGRRLCILMGVGPKGLPASLLRVCPHHVELTGAGVPLETATVMGLLAERMRRLPAPAGRGGREG